MRDRLWRALIRLRVRDESAQTGTEYLGVLLVVAAVIALLIATGPGQAIGDALSGVVQDIAGDR